MADWELNFFHRDLTPDPIFKLTAATLRKANIGKNYWPAKIELIPDRCRYKADLVKMVASLPEDVRHGKGAVFFGKHGFGKTSAAAIMLKAAMVRGGQCYHRIAGSIEHAYEKRWVETNVDGVEIWDVLTKTQILTIDDLGHELAAGGYKVGDIRIIEELVRLRYDERLTTYITTNLPVQALVKQYPTLQTILSDPTRFKGVEVDGFDWRKGKDPRKEN